MLKVLKALIPIPSPNLELGLIMRLNIYCFILSSTFLTSIASPLKLSISCIYQGFWSLSLSLKVQEDINNFYVLIEIIHFVICPPNNCWSSLLMGYLLIPWLKALWKKMSSSFLMLVAMSWLVALSFWFVLKMPFGERFFSFASLVVTDA